MEADLQRFYHRDYRDRWRRGPDGRRLLTLRQIWVYLHHLPADSALGRALDLRSMESGVLADIYSVLTGQLHPLLKSASSQPAVDPEREQQLRAARRRARERQRLIDAGEIT